jgi:endonuclease I
MKKIIFVLILIFSIYKVEANLDFLKIQNPYDMGNIMVGEPKSIEIKIRNDSMFNLVIHDIAVFSNLTGFVVDKSFLSINPYSLGSFTVTLNPKQNVNYEAVVYLDIEFGMNRLTVPVNISAKANYSDIYYNSTQNLWEDDLYNDLKTLISNHKALSYKDARIKFWSSFDRVNGKVECVYTGKTIDVPDVPDFADLDSKGFNTEHTWPQAFGADKDPQQGDMFHLYITEKNANNKRANLQFDNVVKSITYQDGGSKLGLNESGIQVFEVRDSHKGNVARSLLYFALCYGNIQNYLTPQENTLRKWMTIDPVDNKEALRNDSIYAYQNNRNPFIDHPEFLERLPSISNGGKFPRIKNIAAIDTTIVIQSGLAKVSRAKGKEKENPQSKDYLYGNVYFYNQGNDSASVIEYNLVSNSAGFDIDPAKFIPDLKPFSSYTIPVRYDITDKLHISDTASLSVKFSDGKEFKTVIFLEPQIIGDVEDNSSEIELSQNYPNPFNNCTNIDIKVPFQYQDAINFYIYDFLGNKIFNLKEKIFWNGENGNVILYNDELKKFGNIFYYKLDSDFYSKSKMIILN